MKSNQENEKDISKQIEAKLVSEPNAKEYLARAFKNQDIDLIKLIINSYPELANQVLQYHIYPLHEVTFIKDISSRHEVINLLLNNGANVNIQKDISNNTPLTIAFDRKQIETFYFLLSKGADKDVTLSYSGPYIQYKVDRYFDKINLDKDEKSILSELKKSYEFKFYNYDQLLNIFDWYHSLSKKYKDEAYKNKFHTFFAKAKKDAIEYMMVLQDSLLNNYFQDESNPKSMLMMKHNNLDEQKAEVTSKEINQLQNSIVDLLSVKKIGIYYVPLIMTRSDEKSLLLREIILRSEDYLLPEELQQKMNITIELYDNKKNFLINFAHEALNKESEIEQLKNKIDELNQQLAEQSEQNKELKDKLNLLCNHADIKITDDYYNSVVVNNKNNQETKEAKETDEVEIISCETLLSDL